VPFLFSHSLLAVGVLSAAPGPHGQTLLISATIKPPAQKPSFLSKRRDRFFLVRSCERAARRSGGTSFRSVAQASLVC
jgi:hypothetical protein